jgi:hypothetical protein
MTGCVGGEPFDGVVTKKWADVGDRRAGQTLISEDPSGLQMEADAPSHRPHVDAMPASPPAWKGVSGELTGTVSEMPSPLTRSAVRFW